MKFYQKNWFIILMLIIFFPVGLLLMWKFASWNKMTKWIITSLIAVIAAFSVFIESDESKTEEAVVKELDKEQQK